jgi:hypothetical protein
MHGGETTVVLRVLDFLTGEVHPVAAIPVLTITIFTRNIYDYNLGLHAEVLGDIVLVHVHQKYWDNHDFQLCQWCLVEWKTGRVVRVSVQNLQLPFH